MSLLLITAVEAEAAALGTITDAMVVVGGTANDSLLKGELAFGEDCRRAVQHLDCLGHHLGADAVPGDHRHALRR